MQGLNLLDEAALKGRNTIYGECFTHNAVDLNNPAANLRWRWVVQGDWKLIVPGVNEPKGKVELFQVASDPLEEKDLSAAEPGRIQELTRLLDAWYSGR
jgi:uncharacterized sulfatase